MKGLYILESATVRSEVAENIQYGVYRITNARGVTVYAGRSDTNLQERILDHVDEEDDYSFFYYEEATSGKDAFEKECKLYHRYTPRDNKIHPDEPNDSKRWKCPVLGCPRHN